MKIRIMMVLVAVWAATPARSADSLRTTFTYQGQLKQDGAPANRDQYMEFRLYDNDTFGRQVGDRIGPIRVALLNGLFTVTLNTADEFGPEAFDGSERWLEITVDGTTLVPRQALTAAPHALFARNAATATNATQLNGQPSANIALLDSVQTFTATKTFAVAPSFIAGDTPFTVSSSNLVTNLNADQLDGLDSSSFLRAVPNPLALYGQNDSHVISAWNDSQANGAAAVVGNASAVTNVATNGVYGVSASSAGRGVHGLATAGTGNAVGVWGQSQSESGSGVLGTSEGTGVRGVSSGASGIGVFGTGNLAGLYGLGERAFGAGVFGDGLLGVYGVSSSADGAGVYGLGLASGVGAETRYGVYGESEGSNGTGVYGRARYIGVYGMASDSTGTTYGVFGYCNSPEGFAGYFEGRGFFRDNVGIGTDEPTGDLHVSSSTGRQIVVQQTDTGFGQLLFARTNGELDSSVSYDNANDLLYLANGGAARLVIQDSGNVGIGTSAPTQRLHVVGNILATGSVSTVSGVCCSSDRRLKKNIEPILGALDKVSRLRGVTFGWKVDEFPEMRFGDGAQVGLIAQEVGEVLPEVVSTDGAGGYQAIDYGKIVPVLVEAVKEQQSIIANHRCDLDELRKHKDNEISELRERVAKLEAAVGVLTARTADAPNEIAKRR